VNSPTVPAAATKVAPLVEDRLEALLRSETARWSQVDEELAIPLSDLVSSVIPGGKRLRAAFCYWAFVGAGGDEADPAVVDAGAALEMLHSAALMHDDVIDGSDRRRGTPTVHVEHSRRHARMGWSGDASRFGAGVAILAGDLAQVYGDLLLAGAPREAVEVYDEMRLEVNFGQYLDVVGAADRTGLSGERGVERARRIIRYKTAKYTVERPLHLGAALAAPAAFPELKEPLSRFGLPLGEAFQLRDDLLGVFGDPARTGKPVGEDLREGKPTMLASLAASRARGAGSELFAGRFGIPGLDAAGVEALQELFESTGARTEVENEVERLVAEASAALAELPLRPEAVRALGELAEFVAGRDR
jgi:geranylgeranyl diphosphate synthase type I